MKSVFVLGAGATRAESRRQRRSLGAIAHPPLNAGFFATARHYGVDGLASDALTVRWYMQENHGIDCFEPAGDFVESVMVRIVADYELAAAREQRRRVREAQRAFLALLRLYSKTLTVATRDLVATRNSYMYEAIRHALTGAESPSDITIITFNHDLEIEKTLDRMGEVGLFRRYGPLLALPWSYGKVFGSIRRYGRGNTDRFPIFDDEPDSYVKILKLHGSLNWASLHRTSRIGLGQILNPRRNVRYTSIRAPRDDLYVEEGGEQFFTAPLVIPPVQGKARIFPRAVMPVWDEAETALSEADEVTVFGYSCPAADMEAESLIRVALRRNDSLQLLRLVNPDPAVTARFAPMLSGRPLETFASPDAWMERLGTEKLFPPRELSWPSRAVAG